MNWDEQRALDADHAATPKPGDYWHERFSPAALVIDAGEFFVAYLSKTQAVGSDHWTWDTTHIEVKTREEFKRWLSYGSIPGTWAGVVPAWRGWKAFADAALAHRAAAQEAGKQSDTTDTRRDA